VAVVDPPVDRRPTRREGDDIEATGSAGSNGAHIVE
jgi:hypothetical protein